MLAFSILTLREQKRSVICIHKMVVNKHIFHLRLWLLIYLNSRWNGLCFQHHCGFPQGKTTRCLIFSTEWFKTHRCAIFKQGIFKMTLNLIIPHISTFTVHHNIDVRTCQTIFTQKFVYFFFYLMFVFWLKYHFQRTKLCIIVFTFFFS